MKVLLTGGAGFIGSRAARQFLDQGHSVVVLDDFSTGLEANLSGMNVDLRVGSITDEGFVAAASESCDYVVHLAALGSVPRSIAEPSASFEANAVGTLNVLQACKDRSIPFVMSSSSSVYGSNSSLPKHEDMWCQPMSPYGASKLAAESLALAFGQSYGIPVLALRFFNVFGPGQRADHPYAAVIPRFLLAALKGEPLVIHGDGNQSRDFTYIDTVVDVLSQSVNGGIHHDRPVNLAFGKGHTILEIAQMIQQISGESLPLEFSEPRPSDIRHSLNNPALVRRLFPNIVEPSLDVGLELTYEWIRSEYMTEKSLN
jgi:UDP-glucose 4-epimerase